MPETIPLPQRKLSARVSLAMLLGPASVILFIIALVLWRTFGDAPDKVLWVYRSCLSFGTKLWIVCSVVGLLSGIRAIYLEQRREGSSLVSTVVAIHLISLLLISWAIQGWRSGHKEEKAKALITGAELQAWALQLLSQYPTNSQFTVSALGTNFPRELLKLDREEPQIATVEATAYSSAHVLVMWQYCGLEVGPTNFVSTGPPIMRMWQPGVYFWTYSK